MSTNVTPQISIDLLGLPDVFYAPPVRDLDVNLSVDHTVCDDCCIKMQRRNSQFCICPSCGIEIRNEIEIDYYSNDLLLAYNSNNSSVSLKITGTTKASRIQNNKLMGLTSEYDVLKARRVLQKINAWVYQVDSSEDSIPMNVQVAAADAYGQFQHDDMLVKRAGGLNAVLSDLIYIKGIEMGVPRKPKVITNITGIEDSQLSSGDKIIREMSQKGIIDIPSGGGLSSDYVDQYFEKLNIEEYSKYKTFVTDLIVASSIDKIKNAGNSARTTTRCAGALYILCQQLKLPITRDQISNECNISKSTFARFVNMIVDNKNKKCIRKVFKQHDVPTL